ncbi:hypothetical protein HDU76_007539 [Blyttiomyces sp. JEL0837]|nr:hypothetical protein HDU76_007539 [Blyttiomyces sp. JEL0837]
MPSYKHADSEATAFSAMTTSRRGSNGSDAGSESETVKPTFRISNPIISDAPRNSEDVAHDLEEAGAASSRPSISSIQPRTGFFSRLFASATAVKSTPLPSEDTDEPANNNLGGSSGSSPRDYENNPMTTVDLADDDTEELTDPEYSADPSDPESGNATPTRTRRSTGSVSSLFTTGSSATVTSTSLYSHQAQYESREAMASVRRGSVGSTSSASGYTGFSVPKSGSRKPGSAAAARKGRVPNVVPTRGSGVARQ